MSAARHEGRLEDYNGTYLECRGVGGHAWVHTDGHWSVTTKGRRVTEYRRTLVCLRCPCTREDTYDADMRPVRSTRHYPPGYLTRKGNKIVGATARLEQVRRIGLKPGTRVYARKGAK